MRRRRHSRSCCGSPTVENCYCDHDCFVSRRVVLVLGLRVFHREDEFGETNRARYPASVVARAKEVKSSAQGEDSKTRGVREMFASTAVLGGVLASTALQATFPEQAQALSIKIPSGREVWQFLVLTAGYFIGIEIYLDRKYDDKNKPVMPTVQKKEDAADEAKEE